MDGPREQSRVVTEVITPNHIHYERRQAIINQAIGVSILDLPKHIAWSGGYTFDSLACRETEDGCLVVVKGYKRRKAYVTFVWGPNYVEALELAGELAASGSLAWHEDKWPSKRLKRILAL